MVELGVYVFDYYDCFLVMVVFCNIYFIDGNLVFGQ